MTTPVGTSEHPLRVAIIGSGPSAFYAAEAYLKQSALIVEIDMFERLPTPHGLVRGGVAPDHQKIKSVTKVYDKIAADPRFRFYGNVELGRDVSHADLTARYHQILYATGAQTDRRMGIAGEDLPGSHPATEFVGWYNAHPDYRDLRFDLTQTRVAVIGNGNVAMDVARILARTPEELAATDIADYALAALAHSDVTDIYVIGRRGPAQAAFTNPEIKELGELSAAEVVVLQREASLDPLSQAALLAEKDRTVENNVQILSLYAGQASKGKPRRIHMRFLWSPVEIIGTERVEAIKLVKNELIAADDGSLRARATDETEILPVGLVFRSIGYKGVALPDVPFDAKAGVIPNAAGRVIDPAAGGTARVGEYVAGWIKRGPSGVIGTNKPDSVETVKSALADAAAGTTLAPTQPTRAGLEAWLRERGVRCVTYADWLALDAIEQEHGKVQGRPRIKLSSIPAMLAALHNAGAAKESTPGD
jgi:ferredoxin--NADP+ reductase